MVIANATTRPVYIYIHTYVYIYIIGRLYHRSWETKPLSRLDITSLSKRHERVAFICWVSYVKLVDIVVIGGIRQTRHPNKVSLKSNRDWLGETWPCGCLTYEHDDNCPFPDYRSWASRDVNDLLSGISLFTLPLFAPRPMLNVHSRVLTKSRYTE